ncbi:hypothetical protein [Maridesulfovibrio sp.]|uniref:hypothetical protein n=1 Tax=Maridesulfovibrio sp. TaxID=2795000 RepID=UPI003BA94952
MKTMTKVLVPLALILILCGGASAQESFNAQGSTVVTNIWSYHPDSVNWFVPYINVTNITGTDVQCKITIYDHDGNDITHYSKIYSGGIGNWTIIASGTGEFNLPAHGTRMYSLKPEGTQIYTVGHAVIEWKSNDPLLRKAVIAGITTLRADSKGISTGISEINNGQPF